MEELRGLLGVGVLPEILRRIFEARRSGCLHLASGVEKSDLAFKRGYLTRAGTTMPGAHLGDLLVQIGFISAHDRDTCVEIASLAKSRLGETLVQHRLIDIEHLSQGLALQLREVLARTLLWKGGVYTFADTQTGQASPSDEGAEPRVDPREVLLDATWSLVSDPVIDGLLGDLTQRVKKVKGAGQMDLDFRLTPADAFLLSRIDGELTGEQLLQLSPAASDEAKASLAGLLAVGAIEYQGAPPPSSMTHEVARFELAEVAGRCGSEDPYERLGVKVDVSNEDLRSAYLRLMRLCDPAATTDPELRPILGRMSQQLTDAFVEIERRRGAARRPEPPKAPAPGAAAPPARRPPPASVRKPLPLSEPAAAPALQTNAAPIPLVQAPVRTVEKSAPAIAPSQAIEASAQAFDEGRPHEALAILHDAIPHLAGRERRSARVQKARMLLALEHGAKLAEDELRSAILEDPGNAAAHVELGGIYRRKGSVALATMAYSKALELEPRNAAAREALQELRPPPPREPPSAPSVLKRIFGR